MSGLKTTKDIFQENLRYYRKKKHFTQAELAKRAQVHRTYISEMEAGKCSPSLDVVGRIAGAFEMPGWRLLLPYEYDTLMEGSGKVHNLTNKATQIY